MKLLTPTLRLYLYGVISAALPLLVTAGILAPQDVKDWLFLAAAVLGLGSNVMAAANVNSKTSQTKETNTVPLFVESKNG